MAFYIHFRQSFQAISEMKSLHLLLSPCFWIMVSAMRFPINDDRRPPMPKATLLSDCSTAINAIAGHVVDPHGTQQDDQATVTISNNTSLWETPAWISHGACNILIRSIDPEMDPNTPVSLRLLFWNQVKDRAWMLYREDISRGLMGYDMTAMSGMPDHHMYSLVIELSEHYRSPRNTTTLTWKHYEV